MKLDILKSRFYSIKVLKNSHISKHHHLYIQEITKKNIRKWVTEQTEIFGYGKLWDYHKNNPFIKVRKSFQNTFFSKQSIA